MILKFNKLVAGLQLVSLLSLVGRSALAQTPVAQPAFTCGDGKSYLFQGNPTNAYEINLLSGTVNQATSGGLFNSNKLNAFGYNPRDGYIWGFVFNTNQLVRIGSDYSAQAFTISGLGTGGDFVVGDIDSNGKMYLTHGGATVAGNSSINIRVVDLTGASSSTTLTYSTLSSAGPAANISDWTISPVDGNLYALDGTRSTTNSNSLTPLTLYRFKTADGTREILGTVSGGNPAIVPSTFGAVFMDLNGSMYVVSNEKGYIHRIDRPDQYAASTTAVIPATYVAAGPVASSDNQNNNDGARCATSKVASAALPVTLVSCAATVLPGRRVQLDWRTASELHSAYFEVQHSLDGRVFTVLGRVASQGTTFQASTYSFVDESPGSGTRHYYRLRQVDQDDQSTFGPVQTVMLAPGPSTGQLSALPNPTTVDNLRVQVQYEGATAVAAVLVGQDVLGQTLFNQPVLLQPGTTTLTPAAHLAPGVYWLSLRDEAAGSVLRTKVLVTN